MSEIQDLQSKKYILLETSRKNDQPVRTPVWFVIQNDLVYVITREDTGKVKRIRQNPKVKLAPCTFKGNPIGDWISGEATKVTGEEAQAAINLRKKKYGFMATIAGFASRGKGDLVVFSIKLDL
jgi:PPOX class probable F420-dependent enzyme